MNMIRVGKWAIDLDRIAAMSGDENMMYIYVVGVPGDEAMRFGGDAAKDLYQYMMSHPDLRRSKLNKIKDEAFDPFFDDIQAVFSLYRSLKGNHTLTLGKDGSGTLFRDESGTIVEVVHWGMVEDGIERLAALSKK